jgi:hypothetical protein
VGYGLGTRPRAQQRQQRLERPGWDGWRGRAAAAAMGVLEGVAARPGDTAAEAPGAVEALHVKAQRGGPQALREREELGVLEGVVAKPRPLRHPGLGAGAAHVNGDPGSLL